MLKAVLVDDEVPVLGLLERTAHATGQVEVIGMFTSSEAALANIPSLRPDVVFLDVSMPRMNGMELAAKLAVMMDGMAIVFVTAYEQYAVRAFQLSAVHYLLKPVTTQAMLEAIQRIPRRLAGMPEEVRKNPGKIYLFGNTHLHVEGARVEFLTSKIEELLVLLIVHRDKGISKWTVIDILWGESSKEKSQQNLYTMIFRLKKMLDNAGFDAVIQFKGGVYMIDLSRIECDLVAFESFVSAKLPVNAQTIEGYEETIALYGGDFLGDKGYIWGISYRERYYQQFREMVSAAAGYYRELNRESEWRSLRLRVKPLLMEEDYDELF